MAPFSIWRRMVEAEARQAELELNEAERAGNPYPKNEGYRFVEHVAEARAEIRKGRSAATNVWPSGIFRQLGHAAAELISVWTGSEYETAFAALHRAEGAILVVAPDAAVRSEALKIESIFKDNNDIAIGDPRHAPYTELFLRIAGTKPPPPPPAPPPGPPDQEGGRPNEAGAQLPPPPDPAPVPVHRRIDLADRIMLREIRRQQNESWEIARSRIRIFRNILTVTIPFLSAVLVVIAVLAWQYPSLVTLRDSPLGSDVGLVEFLGAFGGLLSAVATVQALKNFQRFYGLPLAQTILKLPAGAATALAGMILLQHGLLGTKAVEWNLVVPYALAFGIAQLAVTRRIDSRASALLGDANSKSPGTSQTAPGPHAGDIS